MRYFRKLIPATRVIVFQNQGVLFPSNDGMVGYYATDNASLCAEFEKHMRANRFGISEITQAEYETEFVQKKTGVTLRPLSREEFSGAQNLAKLMESGSELLRQSAAVAVASDTIQRKPSEKPLPRAVVTAPMPETPTIAIPIKNAETPPEKPNFQPTVGKRKHTMRRPLPAPPE